MTLVVGYGQTEKSTLLNQLRHKIFPSWRCEFYYDPEKNVIKKPEIQRTLPNKFDDSLICAGDKFSSAYGTCAGDSGGPLVYYQGSTNYVQTGVVSWGAPNLSAMDSSKEDKLGTANWASHLPNIGSSSRMNNNGQQILQPPPSIPLPPSANTERGTDTLTSSQIELNKTANQDLASKAPGYRANLNASPSWGPISNANLAREECTRAFPITFAIKVIKLLFFS